jgi:membrane protein DedA with SNARE-associated domain
MLSELTNLARDAVTSAGYPGILGAMLAENLFPPIPSEVVLPLAGYESSQGSLTFAGAVLAATAGSLLGALVLYALGRWGGRRAVWRWGPLLRVGARDLEHAERWFARWGDWVVLGARLVPLARSVVSIPAGTVRMPLPRFVVLTTAGSLAWNVLLVGAGYQLGAHWEDASDLVGRYSDVMLAIAALAVALCAASVWRRRARRA